MDFVDTPSFYLAGVGIGIALHLFMFRKGEWDLYTVNIILTTAALEIAAFAGLLRYSSDVYKPSYLDAARIVLGFGACICTGLYSSLLAYRGFFHRLRKFPGPLLARFTNFYPTYLEAKNLRLYEEVQKLHQQYGDIVRLGPSELSINNAEIFNAVHAPNSGCTKGPWYNILYPMVSLQLCRDKHEHARRRKVWDRGFGAKALREYEPRVIDYTQQLMDQIEKKQGQSLNVTDWFNFYSFDVMGDLAWGKSFGMLRDGIKHYFMESLHADMTNVGLFSHLTWLFPLFKATPILNIEHKRFWNWVNSQVSERKNMKPDRPDVFSWLLEEHDSKKPTAQEEIDLIGDAYLIAVAGSDTTAASLTCLFYQLALNPSCLKTLQTELNDNLRDIESPEASTLSKLPYLNAVINETLRLHPPVPGGVQRMTPPQGLTVGDVFIPGDTIVQTPSHTIFRDGRYFVKPQEFIPERWTTSSEPGLVINGSVFAPFSVGRYSCIGKQLGLMEIRYVTAQLLRRYDIGFAPGERPEEFIKGKKDTFTLTLGPLHMIFDDEKTKSQTS